VVVESVAWACTKGGVQCAGILEGCGKRDAPSAVYSAYFQKHFQRPGRCNFSNTGTVTTISPSVYSTSTCPFPGRLTSDIRLQLVPADNSTVLYCRD